MLSRVIAVSVAIAIVILAIILHMTQPSTVGPLGILVVFILMYVSVLGVLTFLLYGVSQFISRISASFTVKKPIHPLSLSRAYYFSSVIALAPVMLIGMQSVAKVEIQDVVLIIVFVVIACIYISKRTS
jgi:hypothetical protein